MVCYSEQHIGAGEDLSIPTLIERICSENLFDTAEAIRSDDIRRRTGMNCHVAHRTRNTQLVVFVPDETFNCDAAADEDCVDLEFICPSASV